MDDYVRARKLVSSLYENVDTPVYVQDTVSYMTGCIYVEYQYVGQATAKGFVFASDSGKPPTGQGCSPARSQNLFRASVRKIGQYS